MQLNMPKQMRVNPAICDAPSNRPARLFVLLVEADADSLLRRANLLVDSGYRVETASRLPELFSLRSTAIRLAVVSDGPGSAGLRSTAETVCRQWPLARILILGAGRRVLDGALYDEAVDRRIQDDDLLAILKRLSAYRQRHRVEVFHFDGGEAQNGDTHDRDSLGPRPNPPESDPTKMPGYDSEEKNETQDLPAEERKSRRPQ